MDLFDGAKRPLDFAFRAGRGAAPILASRQMGAHGNVERVHHPLKHMTLRDRTIIGVQIDWATTEREACVNLGGHRVEQKLQGSLDGSVAGSCWIPGSYAHMGV
jgi:hypothetical protein